MDKENAETRKKLKDIGSIRDLEDLLEQSMLSEEEKNIIWMHYKEQKPLSCIADELGVSDATMFRKHAKALKKIGKLFL